MNNTLTLPFNLLDKALRTLLPSPTLPSPPGCRKCENLKNSKIIRVPSRIP